MTQAKPLSPMNTHCIGRYLVDLPEGFVQTPEADVELTFGLDKAFRTVKVQVLRAQGNVPSFESLESKKAQELISEFNGDTPTKNMLSAKRLIDKNTALIRANTELWDQGYFKSFVIAQRGEAVGQLTADIYKGDKPEDVEAKVLAVANRTHFNAVAQPTAKGTCLGSLLIDAGQDGENLTVRFQSRDAQDVSISFEINSMVEKTDGGLFRRLDRKSGALSKLGFTSDMNQRSTSSIAGRPAEEVRSQFNERDHKVRVFTAEVVMGSPASLAAPLVSVEMGMGGQVGSGEYVDASMADDEALRLWEVIIKSIRVRPGSV